MTTACPPDRELDRLLADELSGSEEAALEAHVAGCAACQARLERLTGSGGPLPVPPDGTVLVSDGTPAEGGVLGRVAGLPTAQVRILEQEHAFSLGDGTVNGGPADQSSAPGPRFTVLGPHAEGGLGRVHLARDGQLGRTVALKEIRPERADDPRVRRRFLTEAEITGQLEHPGVVPIYALECDGAGRPVYAMRFIRGRTLGDAIAGHHRRPTDLGLRELLQRFISVCQTVAYAHSKGVIHRDLKPSNVMLGDYGETLVVDWGLAKRLDDPETAFEVGPAELTVHADAPPVRSPQTLIVTPGGAGQSAQLTAAGTVMGTPAYMAPEQARGEPLTPAADIYALGAVLFTLLTGKVPHQGTTAVEVLRKVAAGETPTVAGGHRALNAISFNAMARDPHARYATAAELARDVERWLADEPVSACREPWLARTGRWVRRRKTLVASFGVAAVFLTAAGVGAAWWQSRLAQERRFEQARAAEQIGDLLGRCEDALRADDPDTAAAHLDLAGRRLPEGGAESLRPRFDRLTAELAMLRDLHRLDTLRWTPASGRLPGHGELAAAAEAAFRRYGLSPGETPPDVAAGLVNGSPVRERLLTALDLWLGWAGSEVGPVADGLVATLRAADPDPYRGAVRDAIRADGEAALRQLGERPEALAQPAWFATALGQRTAIPVGRREQILRAAHVRRPNDLTLLITLGQLYPPSVRERVAERVGWYRAAVAARPGSLVAWNNLGVALGAAGDPAGAEAAFREILRLDPNAPRAHGNLGNVLLGRGELDGAEAEFREAVRLDPAQAVFHNGLGMALLNKKDRAGAEAEFREAVRLDPRYARAHSGLGDVLRSRGDLDGAIAAFREAARHGPNDAGFEKLLADAERLKALLPRVPDLAAGRGEPADAREAADLSVLCGPPYHDLFAASARFYAKASSADPKYADDGSTFDLRHAAARCAALAGGGKGTGAPADPAARAALRQQALTWLEANLKILGRRLATGTPASRWFVSDQLSTYLTDDDLAGVLPGAARDGWSPDEAVAWDAYWSEVRAMLAKAGEAPGPTPAPGK